jgi:hypothetical protein
MGNQQRTVELALYRGKSLVSRIIKWISWGIYSHAAIRLPDKGGIIYEAWEGVGVRKGISISDGHTLGTRVDIYPVVITDYEYDIIVQSLESQIGKKYDFKGVFRFSPFLRMFFSKYPSASEHNKWFCSELVLWALGRAGVILLNDEPWKVSPSDIAKSPLLKMTGVMYTNSIDVRGE